MLSSTITQDRVALATSRTGRMATASFRVASIQGPFPGFQISWICLTFGSNHNNQPSTIMPEDVPPVPNANGENQLENPVLEVPLVPVPVTAENLAEMRELLANQMAMFSAHQAENKQRDEALESLKGALASAQAHNTTSDLRAGVEATISTCAPADRLASRKAAQFKPLARHVLLAEAVGLTLPPSPQAEELHKLLEIAGRFVRLQLCMLTLCDTNEWDIINVYYDLMQVNCTHPKDKFVGVDYAQVQSKILHMAIEISKKAPNTHKAKQYTPRQNNESKEATAKKKLRTDKAGGSS